MDKLQKMAWHRALRKELIRRQADRILDQAVGDRLVGTLHALIYNLVDII